MSTRAYSAAPSRRPPCAPRATARPPGLCRSRSSCSSDPRRRSHRPRDASASCAHWSARAARRRFLVSRATSRAAQISLAAPIFRAACPPPSRSTACSPYWRALLPVRLAKRLPEGQRVRQWPVLRIAQSFRGLEPRAQRLVLSLGLVAVWVLVELQPLLVRLAAE